MKCKYCLKNLTSKNVSRENEEACYKCMGSVRRELSEDANKPLKFSSDYYRHERKRVQKIAAGEEKDDFTNHFYSHFGFVDEPIDLHKYKQGTGHVNGASTPRSNKTDNGHVN